VITVILLALFLGILWARDRVRRRSRSEPA
jgi:hypothetical protein